MKLRRRRRSSGGFYLCIASSSFSTSSSYFSELSTATFGSNLCLWVLITIWTLCCLGSNPLTLSLFSFWNVYAPLHFKFNISNHDKVCCLWKLSQYMSSKTVAGLQKQTLLEATATCSSWETKGEKIVLRLAARQGWHLTVVMRDKWGRRAGGLSCELSKQFQVHCSRCLDFRVLKVYAQVAASYLCRLPTSFFANWLYEVTWPRGS